MDILLTADDCLDGDSKQVWLRRVTRKIITSIKPPAIVGGRNILPPVIERNVWNHHVRPAVRDGVLRPIDPETGALIRDKGRLAEGVVTFDALVDWGRSKGWSFTLDTGAGWDATIDASKWFAMEDLTARDAAMLLCRIDPLSNNDPERVTVDGDRSTPRQFALLLKAFRGRALARRSPRTLLHWLEVAREGGLGYHPWIDEYIETAGIKPAAHGSKGPQSKKRGVDDLDELAYRTFATLWMQCERDPTNREVWGALDQYDNDREGKGIIQEIKKGCIFWVDDTTGSEKQPVSFSAFQNRMTKVRTRYKESSKQSSKSSSSSG